MYSVVCCYNNREMYYENIECDFISRLTEIDSNCELIGVDNSKQRFLSAAEALNWGCERAKGSIIIVMHQDIIAEDSFFELLKKVTQYINNNMIIGAGGINQKGIYTNIRHTKKKIYAGEYRVKEPIRVDTVDECMFIFTRELWSNYRFNEFLTDGWHLYAAELCLRVRKNGGEIWAADLPIFHFSPGRVDEQYLYTFKRMCNEYKGIFSIIRTMNFSAKTKNPEWKLLLKRIRIRIRRLIKGS